MFVLERSLFTKTEVETFQQLAYKYTVGYVMDGFDLNINAGITKKLIYYVELTKEKNTKESGIRKIVEYVGLSNEDTIAIEDSMNDGGIAMGNGVDYAKEKADFVTKDILEDGIEYAFKKVWTYLVHAFFVIRYELNM